MRRLGLLVALLLAPTLVLLPAAPSAAEEAGVDSAYVKVALTHDGQTYEHPGFRVAKDEQGVFVIECGGQNHEVSIVLRDASEEKFAIAVEYRVDGRNQLREELEVAAGEDARLSKGETKLAINLDPRGKKDTSRKDEDKIDGPDSDDPLGGM